MIRLALALLFSLIAGPLAGAEPASRPMKVGQKRNMEATLYTPQGAGPFPSVLVLHTSMGLAEIDRQYCLRLARAGFQCLVPAFLRAHGIVRETLMSAFTSEREAILADLRQALDEMNRLPNARPGVSAAVGFSNGGFFSVLLAAEQRVQAGVGYYGALAGVGQPAANNPFMRAFSARSAPVLLLMGENDSTLGLAPVRQLENIMKAAGAPYDLKIYLDAEHGFDRNNLRPGNQAAGEDAWRRTLAFLQARLR